MEQTCAEISRLARISRPSPQSSSVSVVIPVGRPANALARCLESLATQTLEPHRFEVIAVVNGSAAADQQPFHMLAEQHSRINLRLIFSPLRGAAHARNLGMSAARMQWITLVDDDDFVTPEFLQTLLDTAGPGTIGATFIDDVDEDGHVSTENPRNEQLLKVAGSVTTADKIPRVLGFNAAKIIPTSWARAVTYDDSLHSGEDVVYFAALQAKFTPEFSIARAGAPGRYLRYLSSDGISRRHDLEEFAVSERLDVIGRLEELRADADDRTSRVLDHLIGAQAAFIRTHCDKDPSAHARVRVIARQRELDNLPWEVVNRGRASGLVVSACFPPFNDPSAITAAKRIRQREDIVDVVYNDMSAVRTLDDSLTSIAAPWIAQAIRLTATPSFGDHEAALDFARVGAERLRELHGERLPYSYVYSRVLWPASHVLAALLKARQPELHWIAEFSDPPARGVTGARRPGTIDLADPIVVELLAAARQSCAVPDPTNVFELVEYLPYALADELWFTNDNQRDYMLGYCPSAELAGRARRIGAIHPHPIPDAELYHAAAGDLDETDDRSLLAYFGTFYANRSISGVLDALASLDPATRRRLRLDVYSKPTDELNATMNHLDLHDVVRVLPPVPYLTFLARTRAYDCLIVNDALTGDSHSANPYLPSKWSDYRGSGVPIWALVEPGSTLAALDPEHRSPLGDLDAAVAVLRSIAAGNTANRLTGPSARSTT